MSRSCCGTAPVGKSGESTSADARRPVEETAPGGQRRPVGDAAALAAPRQMPAARARDAADQHPPRPQRVAARAMRWWLDHPLTASADQLTDSGHAAKPRLRSAAME
jgi:hypothetical protein